MNIKNKVVEITKIFATSNIKLQYINAIKFTSEYNLHHNMYEEYIIIEVLKHEYFIKNIIEKILLEHNIHNIKIVYVGEYSSRTELPLNMWVKMNATERAMFKSKKSPCLGCECLNTACNIYDENNVISCNAIKQVRCSQ